MVVTRRVYSVLWPNSLWHIDGHRSLIQWGFETGNGGKILAKNAAKRREPEIENGGEVVRRRDTKLSEPGLKKTGKREAKKGAKEKFRGKENCREAASQQKVSHSFLFLRATQFCLQH